MLMMTGGRASSSLVLEVVIVSFDVQCSEALVIRVSSELDSCGDFDYEEFELLVESLSHSATLALTQVGGFLANFFTVMISRLLSGNKM